MLRYFLPSFKVAVRDSSVWLPAGGNDCDDSFHTSELSSLHFGYNFNFY